MTSQICSKRSLSFQASIVKFWRGTPSEQSLQESVNLSFCSFFMQSQVFIKNLVYVCWKKSFMITIIIAVRK